MEVNDFDFRTVPRTTTGLDRHARFRATSEWRVIQALPGKFRTSTSRSLAKTSNLPGDRAYRWGPRCTTVRHAWLRYVPRPPGECAPWCSGKRKPIIGMDLRIETQRRIGNDRGSPEGSIPANLLPIKDLANISPLPVRIRRDEHACLKSGTGYDRAGSRFVTALEILALSGPVVRSLIV